MNLQRSARRQFLVALGISTLVSVGLFGYEAWRTHSSDNVYLVWNLLLAWLPLIFAARLMVVLRRKLWSSWEALLTSVVWLVFLPNSFYLISDFIHLQDVQSSRVLYDSVMYTSFIYNGVVLGFCSLYLVHLQLKRRLSTVAAGVWIGLTLVLSGVAIYIGRDLRWNSWNIITNPGGLLFDVSEKLLHPRADPAMLTTTISFAVLLISMYVVLYRGAKMFTTLMKARPKDLHNN